MKTSSVLATVTLLTPQALFVWSSPVSRSTSTSTRPDVISISSDDTSMHPDGDVVVDQATSHHQSGRRNAHIESSSGPSDAATNLEHHFRMANYQGPIYRTVRGNSRPSTGTSALDQYWHSLPPDHRAGLVHRGHILVNTREGHPYAIDALTLQQRQVRALRALLAQRQKKVVPIRPRPRPIFIGRPIGVVNERKAQPPLQDRGRGKEPIVAPLEATYQFPSTLHPAGSSYHALEAKDLGIVESTPVDALPDGEDQSVSRKNGRGTIRLGHARFRRAPRGREHVGESSIGSSHHDNETKAKTIHKQ